MASFIVAQPEVEPISLAEARLQCRLASDDTAEDALLLTYITAARLAAEHELGRALIAQTWETRLDTFPPMSIRLGRAMALSIDAVDYIDPAGDLQTLDSAAYALDSTTFPGWLLPAVGYAWPATAEAANAVRIRFVAGYGANPADVPANVRQWLLLTVGTFYAQRESVDASGRVKDLPSRFVDRLLDSERFYA